MLDQLNFYMSTGLPRRFHTVPILKEQTLAAHSWGVAMLMFIIYGQSEPGLTMVDIMAALTHDLAEERFGDMPAPTKRSLGEIFPDFREKYGAMEQRHLTNYGMNWEEFLDDDKKRRLKLCDSLEGALYCCRERALGNRTIRDCFVNFRAYVAELLGDRPEGRDVPFDGDAEDELTIAEREWLAFDYVCELWDNLDD